MNYLIPLGLLAGLVLFSRTKKSTKNSNFDSSVKPKLGIYKSYGVSDISYNAGTNLLIGHKQIDAIPISSSDVRNNIINNKNLNILLFLGGSGSQQGKDLQDEGRKLIREFVWNGGNYIGVCGGAYLALQGDGPKLAFVAGKNYGDYWQRGSGECKLLTNDNKNIILHYENGPIFDHLDIEGISPYQTLATFESDFYIKSKGTLPGQMPGKPAIIISNFGKGKVLLFSPNPIIGNKNEYHPELMINGIKWLVKNKSIPQNVKFSQVFGKLTTG